VRERIGSYQIEVLAEGGMGRVYKGRHETLGRYAAIKTLLPKNAGDAALRERFRREAQAQARLQHPNIVTVYDFIEEDGDLFLAMELVEGGSLETLLRARPRGRMALDEALPLFTQVLDALAYVHGEKIVHRDVKPSNVMVCSSGAKLSDFGIALLTEAPRVTTSQHVMGSLPYMSPEQLEAKNIDLRSDIYSASLVLFRMLAGRPAYEAKEYLAQIHERLAGPPDLRTLVPELPTGLCEALATAWHYDRDQRFSSVVAFREALLSGAAGFLASAAIASNDTVVDGDAPTEPLILADDAEPRGATAVVALVIAGAFVAAVTVLVTQRKTVPFPTQAPRLASVQRPTTTIIFDPGVGPIDPPKPVPNHPRPQENKSPLFLAPRPDDSEAKRRREIDALREAIARGFERAERELVAENFTAAIRELDRTAEMAQRYPADFQQAREQIAALRDRVINAQVAAQTRKAQDALWAAQLAQIEDDIRAERWPEAERFATRITKDPQVPAAVAAHAKKLLQQAKDGRRNAFKDIHVGTTSNTPVRKPSSPPRKER